MCDHNHDHEGCCNHGDTLADEFGSAFSLYQKIDTNSIECLNEHIDGSGMKVFKAWTDRHNDDYVESQCDAELLFNIPFTGDVKLKGIIVIADQELSKVRLFKSSLRMSFDGVAAQADQEIEITHDPQGTVEYPVKSTKFFNVHHLSIHLENRNKDDDDKPCKIHYIGLKGEFTQVNRDGIVIANYEIRPTEGIPEELKKHSRVIQ